MIAGSFLQGTFLFSSYGILGQFWDPVLRIGPEPWFSATLTQGKLPFTRPRVFQWSRPSWTLVSCLKKPTIEFPVCPVPVWPFWSFVQPCCLLAYPCSLCLWQLCHYQHHWKQSCFLWQHLASSFLQCSHTIAFKDSTLPSSVYFSVLQGGGVLNPQRWVREWHMTILHSFFPSSLEGSSFQGIAWILTWFMVGHHWVKISVNLEPFPVASVSPLVLESLVNKLISPNSSSFRNVMPSLLYAL